MHKFRHLLALLLLAALLLGSAPAMAEQSTLSPDDLAAESAILIDGRTGEVVFEKNADRAMYPASTTKIMTCLLALEYGHLDETVTISQEAADVPKDSSLMPVTPGEQMSFRDLIHGLMLHSGNDSANAIAVVVAGSVDAFVARMNERAAQLGMTGTRYVNAHGYHADGHYTTARDMAILARTAMENETFRQIVSTPGYIIEPTNKRSERLKMVNTNLMILDGSEYYDARVIGVKTGFTKAAGQTFVFAAQSDGAYLIGVVMKTADDKDSGQRWLDTKALLDYGFARYRTYTFAELYNMGPAAVQIANAIETDPYGGELSLSIANVTGDYAVACLDGDASGALTEFRSRLQYSLSADLTAPISSGTIIGTVSLTDDEGNVSSATLVASRSIEEQPKVLTIVDFLPFLAGIDLDMAGKIVKIALCVLAVLFVLRTIARARRNARRRAQRRRARNGSSYYRSGKDRYYR